MNKPKALKKGDTIGIVAPSSPTTERRVRKGCEKLIEMGFKVKMGRSPYKRRGYLSGIDSIRAEDINAMFMDEEVNGIICMRGGYGSPRILDLLDYSMIEENPKVFVGYSDITALHIAFNQLSDLITYHGPMISSDMIDDFTEFSKDSLFTIIMNEKPVERFSNPENMEIVTINTGIAEGSIVGGNLSLIAATIGTPYEIDTKGKLLFIEEIGEEPYNIDRMLNQLRLSGKLNQANGIILGSFSDCQSKKYKESLLLEEIFDDYIEPIDKPAIYNLQAGHCNPMITLPLGIRCRLDADKREVVALEGCIE